MFDDIRIEKMTKPLIEDIVEHQYDSAELASAYDSSILDLTFDVPGEVSDRSTYHNKVQVNGTQPVEGASGSGLDFEASQHDSVTVDIPEVSPHTSGVTLEAWVKPKPISSAAYSQYIIFKDDEYALLRTNVNTLQCQIFVNGAWQTAESEIPLPTSDPNDVTGKSGAWSHVAMTYDGSQLLCYINGQTYGPSSAQEISGQLTLSGGHVNIGSNASAEGFYDGQVDEVRVLDVLRFPEEVLADALSPLRHGPPRGNVLDLTFSEFGAPGLDTSGAKNDATQISPDALQPGIEGTAIDFDKMPSGALVRDSKSLHSNEVTAEVWVKTIVKGDRLLVGKWNGSDPGWRLGLDNNSGRVHFEVRTEDSTGIRTSIPFVTFEEVNDGIWHHLAGTYDSESIRVYIDGKPAHRICTDPETGTPIDCTPVPEPTCQVETQSITLPPENVTVEYPVSVCATGTIINQLPVSIGAYSFGGPNLSGMEDEVRISNYAKRDFEVAASARLYSAYTQVLSREVQVSNQTAANDNFSYDLLGRVVSNQRYLISPLVAFPDAFVVRTGYDNQGRIASLRYPDGEVVVSQYDRGGTEISLTGYGDFNGTGNIYGKQPYVYAALMTVTGHLASILYGNGVKTTFRYDDGPTKNPVTGNPNSNGTFGNELLAEQLTVLPSGEVLQDQGYKYDSVGNLISRKDYGQPTSTAPPRQHSNPLKATYTYDDLNRLKSFETRFGTALAGSGNYDYDPLGNLISKEGATLEYGNQPTASLCVISFPARPPHAVTRVIQAGAKTDYCYDANGSLAEVLSSTGVVTSYKHNTRDQLVEIANSTGKFQFVYDSNGTRVYKVEPGQTPQGSISNVTTEPFPFYRITSQGIEKYYFAEGRRIARRTELPNWAVSWYHPEHLGSTNYMTDADGNELQSAYGEYIPYGGAILTADNNTAGSQDHKNTPNSDQSGGYQFNGKELDDTRLYDYGARYYDPVIGRFLEPDNVTVNMKPQGLNPYSYVLNNPLRYVDPTGHEPEFNVDKMREQFFKKVQQRLDLFRPPVYLYMVGYLDYVQSQGGFVLSGNLPTFGEYYANISAKVDKLLFETIAVPMLEDAPPLVNSGGPTIRATPQFNPNNIFNPVQTKLMENAVLEYGLVPYAQTKLLNLIGLSGAAPEVSNVTSEAGMRLEYSVIREGETVFEGTISSGAGGHWGHAEMRFLDKYFDLLKPGDTVLLQGEYALCSYGLCRGALNITSLAADVDILYYGYKPYPSLTYFARGIGHVPAH